jgi:hypothetical protein
VPVFCQGCSLTGVPTNGIYFENSAGTGGNWNGVTKSGATSANVCAPSNFGLNLLFHTLEIRNDGTNITFYFDGVNCGSTLATAASVPTTALAPFFSVASTNGSAKNMDVDAFQFDMQVQR